MLTTLKVIAALLGAVACLIPYLALSEEYERNSQLEPEQGRVIAVEADLVRYEVFQPDSQWDDDGDGWIGPYSNEDVPQLAREKLSPGAALELRAGELELSRSPPTKLLLVGFIGCLLLGVYWGIKPTLARRQLARAGQDPIRVIQVMLGRTRSSNIVVGLLVLGMGGAIAAVALVADGKLWERGFLIGLGSLSALVAVPALMRAWRLRSLQRAPVVDAILHHPERIVWIYEQVVTVNGMDQHNVFLGFDDGERFDFNLGEDSAQPLIEALGARLPDAVVGFSEQRHKQWSKSPQGFRSSTSMEE